MPLIRNHAQQPPGGHVFVDPTGHHIAAKTVEVLLARIIEFRQANGLPPGNPEAEVEADYRTRFPWLVSKVGTIAAPQQDSVARWVNRMWKSPPRRWVESVERERRAETCVACPHYDAAHQPDADTARRILILGAGRERQMGACLHHGFACGLAVAIQDHDADPIEGCWVKSVPPTTGTQSTAR